MLTDNELLEIIQRGESDRVEFKQSRNDLDKFREAICAFANDLPDHREPGLIFVGVKDDGTCANLTIDDKLLQTLGGLRSDGKILPFPSLEVDKKILDGCEIAVIQVEPSDNPPVKPDQLREIDRLLKRNISTALNTRDYTHIETPDYPFEALRELVRNAVIHRNYDSSNTPVRIYWFADRVEIISPGSVYGEVKRENFGTQGITAYRNPTIAEAMRNMGFMQRFGMGIPMARRALAANDNPELQFEIEDTLILAEIGRRQ